MTTAEEKAAILAKIKASDKGRLCDARTMREWLQRLQQLEDPFAGTVPESGSEHVGRKGRGVKIKPF